MLFDFPGSLIFNGCVFLVVIAAIIMPPVFIVISFLTLRKIIQSLSGPTWQSAACRCTTDTALGGLFTLIAVTLLLTLNFNQNIVGEIRMAMATHMPLQTAGTILDVLNCDAGKTLRWLSALQWFIDHFAAFVLCPAIFVGFVRYAVDQRESKRQSARWQ